MEFIIVNLCIRPASSIHFHCNVPFWRFRFVSPAYLHVVIFYSDRVLRKSPRFLGMHLDAQLSMPITFDYISKEEVLTWLLRLFSSLGKVIGVDIAMLGTMATSDPKISYIPPRL